MAWRDASAIVGILAGTGLAATMAARSSAWIAMAFAIGFPLLALLEWRAVKRAGGTLSPDRMLVWILGLVIALVALTSDMASIK